jgi:type II secretion system protein N
MKLNRPLLICVWTVSALLLFMVLTIIFIPASGIRDAIARGLERQGYTMRTSQFGKAFPLGLKARDLEISDDRGSLVRLDRVSARLSLPALCIGRIVIHYHAEIGKGTIDGDVSPMRNSRLSLDLEHVQLEDIPLFRTVTEAQVKGDLNANADVRGTQGIYRGELRLWVRKAVLNGVKIGGMPLPDASYDTIQGMCRVNAGKVNLESFTLQGKGLYVRLKGEMTVASRYGSAPLNLTLELMPKPEFLESQKFVFLLLTKYLTTPGHYQVPIRGTLAKPVIQ